MHFRRYAAATLLLVVTTAGVFATPSHAQTAGDGFLFRVPHGAWTVRGGFDRAIAGGDVFAFVTKQLTLTRSDFGSATFGSSLAIAMSNTNDLVFDLSFASVSRGSEFRDWIDNNNQPITQTTSLRRVPLTIGLRHYLAPRGRAIGHFAWIPARQTTYVGFGVGYMAYRFRQVGDFVDFQTLNVFPDQFESNGWTPVLHASFGADFALGRFFLLNGEARYTWAHGATGRDYVGFHKIDLSGLSATAGVSLRL